MKYECPTLVEAPGRSKNSNTSTVEAVQPIVPEELTESQLEQLLANRLLARERSVLAEESDTNTVTASGEHAKAVGSLIHLDVCIEGVPVRAMVDTGAQSTIISRSTLLLIHRHLRQQGRALPELELPTVRLYGKDGEKGSKQLVITAQVPLVFTLDDRSVSVPVFIQPDSEQACLMGMNVIPLLGIRIVHGTGKPVLPSDMGDTDIATVSLVESATLPSQKGRVVKGILSCPDQHDNDLLFEPNHRMLDVFGLDAEESVVTANDKGEVWVPIQNFQGMTAYLEAGAQLGTVRSTEVEAQCGVDPVPYPAGEEDPLPFPPSDPLECESSSSAAALKAVECTPERAARLMKELELPTDQLSTPEMAELTALLTEFSDVFALDDSELGCTDLVKHVMDTGNHAPIKQQPYRTPIVRRKNMAAMIRAMEEQGVVKPSSSPWASPVVLVPKKDGSVRFCVDYRRLNAITRKDVYPLPRIDDILDALAEARYFSTLDLASGYWQIQLDEDARSKSAFTTYSGLYEFTRMPFGLCNGPATFQRLVQRILAGIEWRSCFSYIDDLLAASATFKEHLQHLRDVFVRLRKSHLRLRPKKCHLFQPKVHFLGYVISSLGIQPDPAKTEKVRLYPRPVDVTSVRQFLGLASYYRRFVSNFATIAAPLHALTKKNAIFQWTPECEESFQKLKEALTTPPVLAYPRFGPDCYFILETDASTVGLGAVVSQAQPDGDIHPITYASRSVDKHEKNYGISELETLGLVWAVRYFRHYLLGHPCIVYTDHAACLSILNTSRPSGKLARWALTIQEMDLTIKHKSGKANASADALSRNPVSDEVEPLVCVVQSSNQVIQLQLDELQKEQADDPELVKIIEYVKDGDVPEDQQLVKRLALEGTQYTLIDGVLHHENPHQPGELRMVVPASLRGKLMKEMHGGRFAGHFAWKKTYTTMRKRYWWRGMCGDVEKFCRACLECVTRRGIGRSVRPPLATIPVGGPFHRMGVDVLQLPVTESGNKYVVVFADYFTKWVEAFAVPNQTAETIARLLVEEIFCRHGAPEHLMSDRGANFLSELVLEICKQLQIKKVNTSGYHPQTNGLVEKFNSTLIGMISKAAETSGINIYPFSCLPIECQYTSQPGKVPFICSTEEMHEYPLNQCWSRRCLVDVDDYRHGLTDSLTTAWALAKEYIKGAQEQQKKMYDRGTKDHRFKVGDRVMIYMPIAVTGKSWKLARPYHGPYRILGVTPNNIEARLVDDVDAEPIFVAVSRVRMCSPGMPNTSWTGRKRRPRRKKPQSTPRPDRTPVQGPITRSRTRVNK